MKDSEFKNLQIAMLVVPHADQWPTDLAHFITMKGAVTTARAILANTLDEIEKIETDSDITADAKRRRQRKVALDVIAELEAGEELAKAKKAAEGILARYAEKAGTSVKTPANANDVAIHVQIRDFLRTELRDIGEDKPGVQRRMSFLEAHAGDPVTVSAVLGAPGFLSGLSDAEFEFFKGVVTKTQAPEIVAAGAEVRKAIAELEQGWAAAVRRIAQRARLVKRADGSYHDDRAPAVSRPPEAA